MTSIDRSLPVAAYYQIAHDLQSRIMGGEWSLSRKLPAEAKLSSEYGVSRMTIRQALAELERSGTVVRRQGSGTFIEDIEPRIGKGTVTISSTLSVSQALKDMGYETDVRLVSARTIAVPSEDVSRALQLGVDESVVFFQRNFMANGKCMAVSRSFLPNAMVEGILDRPLEDESVQKTLSHRFGIRDEKCQRWIEAVGATEEDAELFGVEVGSPLVLLTSIFFDYRSRPIDYVRNIWPGDTIRIYLEQNFELSG